ncbi:hypothetical protein RHS04_01998 [Rhizoctonia solani]|uniref:F-box domain-containing protein n=1 Tax=Rhizoctonia solani TaxID=456999 RepID=A0A8H7HDV5_9AGAM|nr:hypothetical protein RHS04_01998 [Rhizoctonia solani]
MLSEIQNKVVSPVYTIPEDVLVEIFNWVIYGLTADNEPKRTSIEHDVRAIYRQLYELIGVCSSWRDTIIHRGSFWSIVPVFDECGCSRQLLSTVMERSLCRSDGARISFAIDSSLDPATFLRPLLNYGSRIRAFNIKTPYRPLDTVSQLIASSSPGTLSELAIYFTDDWDLRRGIKRPIELPFQQQERFNQILGFLCSLRLRNFYIDLHDVSFARLVELKVEEVILGSPQMVRRLFRAISSASNLQYLGLNFISSYSSSDVDTVEEDSFTISLSNLRIVHLSVAWFNDFEMVFKSFVPRNEKWIIFLQDRCLFGAQPPPTPEQLVPLLQGFNIDTLILEGRYNSDWLDGSELSQLLRAVPSIKTLKLNSWSINQQHWEALTRAPSWIGADTITLPLLRDLYMYDARISDENGIRAVVSSHNIQKLHLAGFLFDEDHDRKMRPIADDDDIVVWLASNISDFQLIHHNPGSYKSITAEWHLW